MLRTRVMGLVLLVSVLLGAVIGGLEVAAPTFATAHRAPAASGLLIAALSVGGIIGATIYGSGRWRAGAARRLLVLLGLLTACLALLVAAGSLLVAGALLLCAGAALNPALTTLSLLVDRHVARLGRGGVRLAVDFARRRHRRCQRDCSRAHPAP